ncbi:hypothetical protein Aduo_018531 [Ancylostoma duodenale]
MELHRVNDYIAKAPAVTPEDVQPVGGEVQEQQCLSESDWVNMYLSPSHLLELIEPNDEEAEVIEYIIDVEQQSRQRPDEQALEQQRPREKERKDWLVNQILVKSNNILYGFCYHRKSAKENVYIYQCTHCKKIKKYTSIMISAENLTSIRHFVDVPHIQVEGYDFPKDPTRIAHKCIPIERTRDKANRMSYEEVRKDKQAILPFTISCWLKVIDRIETINWGANRSRR